MTSKIFANFQNRDGNTPFMPLCIYNIKKSLSIPYTEENPSQGDSPQQFDDVVPSDAPTVEYTSISTIRASTPL